MSGQPAGLEVSIELADPVVVGLSAVAVLRVRNRGAAPVSVSARLNLMEGDVRLTVEGPDGATREFRGWQADTAPRRVMLQPGEEIASGINLLHTEAGPAFPTPGRYVLRAEYDPSPRAAPLTSPPARVTARSPATDAERQVAALLADEAVRDALVRVPADAADQLRGLAAGPADVPDTQLARLLIGDAAADVAGDEFQSAVRVSALRTPYSRLGMATAAGYAVRREAADAAGSAAVGVLRGEPFRSNG